MNAKTVGLYYIPTVRIQITQQIFVDEHFAKH